MKKYLRLTLIATLVVLLLSSCLTINYAPYKNMQSTMRMKKDESPKKPQQHSDDKREPQNHPEDENKPQNHPEDENRPQNHPEQENKPEAPTQGRERR